MAGAWSSSTRSSACRCSGSRSRTAARTRSAPGAARAAARRLMFNGHMDTSYSGREPWLRDVPGLPAEGVRPGRAAVRARHLEHEGRARLLRRGRARAAGRRRQAARRRADRRRLRRDREDAVRATRRARSSAATRPVPGTWSRTAASPTCACSASRPRARSCSATSARSGCASASTATSSTPRSARASATRTRSCARTR